MAPIVLPQFLLRGIQSVDVAMRIHQTYLLLSTYVITQVRRQNQQPRLAK